MEKNIKNIVALIAVTGFSFGITSCARNMGNTVVPTNHNKNLTLGQMAETLPGLGTLMLEYSHRFYVAYYAAKNKNWELAKYELHEMLEVQEVGKITRPEHTTALKTFEDNYLNKVISAVEAKEWHSFEHAYQQAVIGCNSCHTRSKHPYIKYRLPLTPPPLLLLEIKK